MSGLAAADAGLAPAAAPGARRAPHAARRGPVVVAALAALLLALALLEGAEPTAQATVNGVVAGTTLALGAVGLALVYGVLRLVNFAHGDMLTLGAYAALLANATLGAPILLAGLVACAATALAAVAGELLLWRPLRARGAGLFQLLLVAIGLAFVLRYGIQLAAGGGPQRLGVDTTRAVSLVGGVRIGRTQLIATLIGAAALGAVAALLRATRIGRQMRAVSDGVALAEATGVDTRRVILATWAIAGALAGLAGVVAVAAAGTMTPSFGFTLLLSLFAATVVGGIGSAYGALAGGLVLGLAQEWSTLLVDPRWKLAIGFAVLIATLVLRPDGLLGQAVRR